MSHAAGLGFDYRLTEPITAEQLYEWSTRELATLGWELVSEGPFGRIYHRQIAGRQHSLALSPIPVKPATEVDLTAVKAYSLYYGIAIE